MRRLTFRLIVALATFAVGTAAVFFWLLNHNPAPDTLPEIKSEDTNLRAAALMQDLLDKELRSRDMSLYDKAGEYCCGGAVVESKRRLYAESMAQARTFIWQHWSDKRRGYIVVTFHGTDNTDIAHFFIEPNSQGEWRVRCRTLREDSYGDDLDWQSVRWRRARKYEVAQKGAPVLAFMKDTGEEDFAF